MAIYHCQVKIGSRSNGVSAVAAAAYRSGEKLQDHRTGMTHDYTHKTGVVMSEISLPEQVAEAHPDYQDRSILWNSLEAMEKRNDARLYREFEVALPVELSQDQQVELVRDFTRGLVDEGMVVDWSIHCPDKDPPNPHCHILTACRPFNEKGDWTQKTVTTFVLDDNGQKIPLIDPATGLQKVRIREGKGEEKLWLREKVIKCDWDKKENIERWRSNWEKCTNARLDAAGIKVRVDHRSLRDQGIERMPQIHVGTAALAIERKSDAGYRNLQKDGFDAIRRAYESLLKFMKSIKDFMVNTRFSPGIYERYQTVTQKIQSSIINLKRGGSIKMAQNNLIKRCNEARDLINLKIASLEKEKEELNQKQEKNTEYLAAGIDRMLTMLGTADHKMSEITSHSHRRRK